MKRIVLVLLLAAGMLLPACGNSQKPGEPAQAPPGVTNPYETQMKVLNKAKDTAAMARERIAAEQQRENSLEETTGEGQ
ncbi:MAG: hypothetical protein AB1921_15770 [Thermodesulfobacteriota bacterium]